MNTLKLTRTAALLASVFLTTMASTAQAADITSVQLLSQGEFQKISKDLAAALSFKPMIPAESLGIIGFDIGIGASATKLSDENIWKKAADGASVSSYLVVPSLRVHKGLPFDIDLGFTATAVPSSNVRLYGGELRWAVLPGGIATPAVALRTSFSTMNGVDQLGFSTIGLDASISKGFAFLTPYAGIGTVKVSSKPRADTGLSKESFYRTKIFVGANINLGLLNFALETDRTGDVSSHAIKLGLRF
jgi:hypothetical protein